MLNLLLIIISSIFFTGIISKVKAKIGARKMPSILQPLYDVIRLFKKGAIYGENISFIFKIAPIIYFSSIITALLFIPVCNKVGLLSFQGDFIFFTYLLGFGKFMMIIGAMDTGSGFEGMGANREALYSMLVEPAFFILFGSMALLTNRTSFNDFFTHYHAFNNLSYAISLVSIFVLIYIAMIENSRMPVDDPKTHLELTMVHEVMILDNSGFDLGIIHISTWLKFSIYGALISNFIIQEIWPLYIKIIMFFATQSLFALIIGIMESFRARNKLEKNPQWIVMLSAIAVIIFLTTLIFTNKIILD